LEVGQGIEGGTKTKSIVMHLAKSTGEELKM